MCNHFGDIAWSAVLAVEPTDLLVEDFSDELNSDLLRHLFTHDSEKALSKCFDKHDGEDYAESYDDPHDSVILPTIISACSIEFEL